MATVKVPESQIEVEVLFFAMLKEATGCARERVQLPQEATLECLQQVLYQQFPDLRAWSQMTLWAVNQRVVEKAHPLQSEDEVALIPPVSGG